MFRYKIQALIFVFCVTVNAGTGCSGFTNQCTVCSNQNQTTCEQSNYCNWCNSTCYYKQLYSYNQVNQSINGTCTQHQSNCEFYSTATDACISVGSTCILNKGQCSSNPPSTSLLPSSSSTTQCNYCTPLGKADCSIAMYCQWQNNSCVLKQINCSSQDSYLCTIYSNVGICLNNFTQNQSTGVQTGNCLSYTQVNVPGNCSQQKTNCSLYSTSQDLCVQSLGVCALVIGYCSKSTSALNSSSTSTSTSTSTSMSYSSLSRCSYCGSMNQTSCNNATYCQWNGNACSLLPDYNQNCSQLFDWKCYYASQILNLCQLNFYNGYQCSTFNQTNGTSCTQNNYKCELYSTSTDLCLSYMGQCILIKGYCPSNLNSSVTSNSSSSITSNSSTESSLGTTNSSNSSNLSSQSSMTSNSSSMTSNSSSMTSNSSSMTSNSSSMTSNSSSMTSNSSSMTSNSSSMTSNSSSMTSNSSSMTSNSSSMTSNSSSMTSNSSSMTSNSSSMTSNSSQKSSSVTQNQNSSPLIRFLLASLTLLLMTMQ